MFCTFFRLQSRFSTSFVNFIQPILGSGDFDCSCKCCCFRCASKFAEEENMAKKGNSKNKNKTKKSSEKTSETREGIKDVSKEDSKEENYVLHEFDVKETEQLRKSLLDWYDKNKRALPWREKASIDDPNIRGYSVWVSEIMLQQTQVATVIDYYKKWMAKWPTLNDLAAANLEEVNEMWSGLGYYSRAKNLHAGAKKIVDELNGNMPTNAAELEKKIPGVGQYTARAIASIAFNQPTGVVDGNVIRVMSRLRAIGASTGQKHVNDLIWKLANTTVDAERPGDYNQALMELGATVCTPKQPLCPSCPVSNLCKARIQTDAHFSQTKEKMTKALSEPNGKPKLSECDAQQTICDIEDCNLCCPKDEPWDPTQGVMNYPRKAKKKAAREERTVVLIPQLKDGTNNFFFITQRPEKGLLANLWEFPSKLIAEDSNDSETLDKLINELSHDFDTSKDDVESFGEVVHIFSHIHQTYCVYSTKLDAKVKPEVIGDRKRWVTEHEFQNAGVSTAMKKVFKALSNDGPPKKKRKVDVKEDKKQMRMDSFFVKK